MSGKETTFIPELSLNPDLSLKVTMHLFLTGALQAAECHVSILEDDGNVGPELKLFKTVSTAAAIDQVVGAWARICEKGQQVIFITKFLAFSPLSGG